MCIISNKIKFCTCGKKQIDEIKHRWELKRRDERISAFVGSIHYNKIDTEIEKLNYKVLLERLKHKTCFDFDYTPKIGDKLCVSFLLDIDLNTRMQFDFMFKSNGWIVVNDSLELLEWMESDDSRCGYTTFNSGKINHVFKADD